MGHPLDGANTHFEIPRRVGQGQQAVMLTLFLLTEQLLQICPRIGQSSNCRPCQPLRRLASFKAAGLASITRNCASTTSTGSSKASNRRWRATGSRSNNLTPTISQAKATRVKAKLKGVGSKPKSIQPNTT